MTLHGVLYLARRKIIILHLSVFQGVKVCVRIFFFHVANLCRLLYSDRKVKVKLSLSMPLRHIQGGEVCC